MYSLIPSNIGPGDCEFDDDSKPFCDWEQDATDNQVKYPNWMRGSSTPSANTGPEADHTTGSGMVLKYYCIMTRARYHGEGLAW